MNNFNLNKFLFLCLFMLFFASCRQNKQNKLILKISSAHKILQDNAAKQTATEKRVTVWIHGTYLFFDHCFHDGPGFVKAIDMHKKYTGYKVCKAVSDNDCLRYPSDLFYSFNWSGDLSHTKRKQAAWELYDYLIKLIKNIKSETGIIPKITLICHSHGGNVALNMVKLDKLDEDFVIDKLVLLACPVQKHTKDFITGSIFNRVYSIYSTLDLVQVLDPQGFCHVYKNKSSGDRYPLFSQRKFAPNNKLYQIKMKLKGRGLFHSDFISPKFLNMLPRILDGVDNYELKTPNPATGDYVVKIE